jgi:uncharacterized protein involved in exopolysaccharide biosynthesis
MHDIHRPARGAAHQALSPYTPLIPLDYLRPGLSLRQTVSIWHARRGWMLMILLGVMSLTGAALFAWPRTYVATVALMVNYEVNDPLNGKELPVGQVASYIATQVELMQTPEVLLAVVDRLQLTEDEDYTRGYTEQAGTPRMWAADQLARHLAVFQSQRGGQLIYITYSARQPRRAADVANAVAEVYKQQDSLRATQLPDLRARRYAQQLEELKAKVNDAQRAATRYQQSNALLDDSGKTNVELELLATLESRLVDARHVRSTAEARAAANPSVSDPVLGSVHVQGLRTQIAAQELQQAQLERKYMPQHPDVVDARLQLVSTRQSLASSLQSYSNNASAGLEQARQLEAGLQAAVTSQRGRALGRGRLKDESAKYLLALESAQAVYRRALEGYDQVMFATSAPHANLSLVSSATPPVHASKPRVGVGLALGGLLAVLLSLSIPMALEMTNRRVRCRDDLEIDHHLPVLAEFGRLNRRALT